MRDHCGHNEVAVSTDLDPRPRGRDAASGVDRQTVVAPRRQPGGFTGGVDTAHLHRHRGEPGQAQHQHHNQRGDRQRGLNGARTPTAGYTLVLSARPMMLVSADTMESPVTTV